jgi:DNA-binding MarR family transcriptional regulator
METLTALFGSSAKVRILRLFLLNESLAYSLDEISTKSQAKLEEVRTHLKSLEKANLVNSKEMMRDIDVIVHKRKLVPTTTPSGRPSKKKAVKITKETKTVTKKVLCWALNTDAEIVSPLRSLLIESEMVKSKDIAKRLGKSGAVKLLILSGIFVKNGHDKVDIVMVGDKIDQKHFQKQVKQIEAEVGKELRYSVFSPEDFSYRMQMFDKFLFDVLANPHEKLIQKIEIPRT